LRWILKKFSELTVFELHDLLQLRTEIFVVEQQCAYPEIDGKDLYSTHLLGYLDSELAAYARWYPEENSVVMGRIATRATLRRRGVGVQLMNRAIEAIGSHHIHISAQQHLERYYGNLGFETVSDVYDDYGIPHIDMIRDPDRRFHQDLPSRDRRHGID
jgi:ElaA protein